MITRDSLTDFADDALGRLERVQGWWHRQSPHPALTQLLLCGVSLVVVALAYGDDAAFQERALIGTGVCLSIGWLAGFGGSFRTVGPVRVGGGAEPGGDDATRDIDMSAIDARRRMRLWSACFWWLQLPWLTVTVALLVLRSVALVWGSEVGRVGLGCTQIPLWGLSVPLGFWGWQRHFRRASRGLGSRTELDLDGRVFWCAVVAILASFAWAGVLIV